MITYKPFRQNEDERMQRSEGNHQSCQTFGEFGLLPERLVELGLLLRPALFLVRANTTNDSCQLQCILTREHHKSPAFNLLFLVSTLVLKEARLTSPHLESLYSTLSRLPTGMKMDLTGIDINLPHRRSPSHATCLCFVFLNPVYTLFWTQEMEAST